MTEVVEKQLKRIGVTVSKPVLAVVSIIFGLLVIVFPDLLVWIVGLFFIIMGILILLDYFELRSKQSSGSFGGPQQQLFDLMSSVLAFRVVPANLSLMDVLVILVGLVVLWVVISIPVYLAGKVVTSGKSSFVDAMVASLFGPVVFLIVLIVVDFFLGELIGSGAFVWAYVLAFVAWLWVYKVSFGVGWLKAVALAVLAVVVFFVMSVVLRVLFGVVLPSPFFPSPL